MTWNEVRVHGHSDDIVTVEGLITEQVYGEEVVLAFHNGLTLVVEYTIDGEWEIQPAHPLMNSEVEVHGVGSEEAEEECSYSELATFCWKAENDPDVTIYQ
jgi:hypothetical protein